MKKIVFLNIFLARAILAMEPSPVEVRGDCIERLCALGTQVPEAGDDIQAIISRLTNEDDIDAPGDAEALIYVLQSEMGISSERAAREMRDAELAERAQLEMEDAELARRMQLEMGDARYARLLSRSRGAASSQFVPGLDVTPLVYLLPPFFQICQRGKFDFDVHALDPLVGDTLPKIHQFLDEYSPITRDEKELYGEDLNNLSLIADDFQRIMQGIPSELRSENDLTKEYLSRSFEVLQQGQHAALVPMFVQIYTLINKHTPSFKEYFICSFLSNVNKFKGGECYAGYRNRFFATLLSFVEDYGKHTGQIELELE
ncbi:MAG: hypothetical protein LBC04_00955 [Holosporaceae bacterium]|nr:hypothetical protein [Holosporaceae bacterium]